jgi:PAS domain S-box-containing protein
VSNLVSQEPPDDSRDSPQSLRRELERYRTVVTELQRRIAQLQDELETVTTMAEVPAVVVTQPELRNTLARLVNKVAMIVQTEKVLLMLHQPETGELTLLPPALGVTDQQASEFSIGSTQGISGWVFQNREAIVYNDAINHPRAFKEKMALLRIRNGICVPLVIKQRDEEERLVDEHVIGVMHVCNKRHDQEFNQDDLRLMEMLAEQAAAVISNAQVYIQLTEEKEQLQEAFESIHVGVMVFDRTGLTRLMNPAACEILDIPYRDYAGTTVTETVPLGDIRDFLMQNLEQPEERSLEITLGEEDGRIYQAQTTFMTTEQGDVENVVAIFYDITEIRRVERMKTAFVSTVSHELRTPLTSIKGFISTLLEDHEGMYDDETRGEFLIIIDEECDRLTRLISDLLNVSRIESGRGLELQLSDVDLAAAIERSAAAQPDYGARHELVVEVPEQVATIRADADKLAQILDNLVGNAIKYSPHGGKVKVTAHDEGDSVRIDVSDEGLGIPERHRDKIFERFHQVDDDVNHKAISGTGIGLYLVQHLVHGHGGSVWLADSEVGRGSTFSVRLPKDPEAALQARVASS